jgi:pyrophosphatase PpaX
MFKGIVFDLDGTLVDSLSVTFEAFNHGFMLFGAPKLSPAEIMKYFGPGEAEIFGQIVGTENAEAAYAASKDHLNANLERTPLHEGVGDLLEKLKTAGIPISIFTGRSWPTTQMILSHHNLLDRFITVIANEHVQSPKPSPEGLYLAAERMKIEPKHLMFVGDSPSDIIASRSAGASGVAALWDLQASRDLLAPWKPHFWVEKPKDVLTLINLE